MVISNYWFSPTIENPPRRAWQAGFSIRFVFAKLGA